MAHTWVIVVVTIRLHGPAHRDVVRRFALSTHAGERGHRQRDDDIDLVTLPVLRDPPASARLDRDRAADRETNVGGRIDDDVAAANDLEKVLAGVGQVAGRLGKLLDVDPFARETLHDRMKHVGIEEDLLNAEALVEIEQRPLDGRLEINRIVGLRLETRDGRRGAACCRPT